MLGQTLTGNMLRLETDQAAVSQDLLSGRRLQLLWTGLGFAIVTLAGLSACALAPLDPHASAKPARLLPEVAFNPSIPALRRPPSSLPALRPALVLSSHAALRPAVLPRARPGSSIKMMAAGGEAQKVKVGDMVPDVSLDSGFPAEKVKLRDLTKGKRVVLVGLFNPPWSLTPGASTPTWSSPQIPGYLAKQQAELRAKGVSDVITYCVEDGAVMKAWAVDQKVENSMIEMFADPISEVTNELGMLLDHPGLASALGYECCKRFSMFIDDGIIEKINIAKADNLPGEANPAATLVEEMLLDIPALAELPAWPDFSGPVK